VAKFSDRATTQRGFTDILKWKLGSQQKPDAYRPPLRLNDGSALRAPQASATWIGHATYAVRLSGQMIVTDPVWSERLSGVVQRLVPPGVAFEHMPPIDIALVTHDHYDHMDKPSLQRIGPKALYVTPLGNGEFLRSFGAKNVVELDWWQTHTVVELTITCVPARHWSMRMPWNRNDMLWSGFVVRGQEGGFYHSGDTAYFDGFKEIGTRCGPIDWAMLPIGAYAPRWFMEPQHMNPEDAWQAFQDLGAKHLLAMHWGTFRLTDEPLAEPVEKIRALFANDSRLWVFDIGETRPL